MIIPLVATELLFFAKFSSARPEQWTPEFNALVQEFRRETISQGAANIVIGQSTAKDNFLSHYVLATDAKRLPRRILYMVTLDSDSLCRALYEDVVKLMYQKSRVPRSINGAIGPIENGKATFTCGCTFTRDTRFEEDTGNNQKTWEKLQSLIAMNESLYPSPIENWKGECPAEYIAEMSGDSVVCRKESRQDVQETELDTQSASSSTLRTPSFRSLSISASLTKSRES